MGVDLTLMPMLSEHSLDAAHDLIQLERRRELWDPIVALPQKPIPKPLACYVARGPTGDPAYGDEFETPYGEPITYTTAADLLTLKDHEGVQDNWQNRAVWAYLAQMPATYPIALWWH